jgi:phosphohistidine phosphatase
MKLYLMQHALAYPAEENPERPLNPTGVKQAKVAAKGIKRLGLKFDLIITSTKRRAQQTAALVAEEIRYPYSDILSSKSVLPSSSSQELLDLLQKEATDSHIMVVGHLPHLAKFASDIMQGGELIFENTGLACFDFSGPKSAQLEFHLKAEQLAT